MAVETFDGAVIGSAGIHLNGPLKNRDNVQAGAIADLSPVSDPPTKAEVDQIVTTVNALLRALRSKTGVGIIAAS